MARELDFYQIVYDEAQKEHCYPFAKIHYNETLTDYFENEVIRNLVPHSQAELISVCSWRLAKKRGDCYRLPDKGLTEQKIMDTDFDVAILTPRAASHKPLLMAGEWHGEAWHKAFAVFKPFLKSIGINVPEELTYAIYENHFIAKGELYKRYVSECLTPSIAFMDKEEIFKIDSGYINKKRQPEIKDYQMKSGRYDWPISTFVLERLFSIWIEGKGLKVVNL